MMECVLIESKLIASAAYYRNAEKLCVWFHSGKFEWHDNISAAVFNNLINADSPGFYYNNYIRARRGVRGSKSAANRPSRWQFSKMTASLALATFLVSASGFFTPTTNHIGAFAETAQIER